MKRFRQLLQQKNRYTLVSKFILERGDEGLEIPYLSAVSLSFDYTRRTIFDVCKVARCDTPEGKFPNKSLDVNFYEMPPLYLIAEEVSYLLNLIKTLLPYETQAPPLPQDLPPLQD